MPTGVLPGLQQEVNGREGLARRPTVRPPRPSMRTTVGVRFSPMALATTDTVSPSKTAIAELVVPRSIPTWSPERIYVPPGKSAD